MPVTLPILTANKRKSIKGTKGDKALNHIDYGFGNTANLKTITSQGESGYSLSSLTYDGPNRMTAIAGGPKIGCSTIRYDGPTNIRSCKTIKRIKNRNLSYKYNDTAYVLTSVSGSKSYTFGYDNKGNVTSNAQRTFKYNLENEMYHSGSNRYLYDGYNRRIREPTAKGVSYSIYSHAGELLFRELPYEKDIDYIYLGRKLVAKDGSGVSAKPDTARKHLKPYGETIETPNDDMGYTRDKFDAKLGLNYIQARYYDPEIVRILSNDPVGFVEQLQRGNSPANTFNRYAYANNNPINYTDPNGEFAYAGLCVAAALLVGKDLIGAAPSYAAARVTGTDNKSALIQAVAGVGAVTAPGAGLVANAATKAGGSKAAGFIVGNTTQGQGAFSFSGS